MASIVKYSTNKQKKQKTSGFFEENLFVNQLISHHNQ